MRYLIFGVLFLVCVPVLAQEVRGVPLTDPLKTQTLEVLGDVVDKQSVIYAYKSVAVVDFPNEIVADRTANVRVIDLGNGQKQYRVYGLLPQFYKDVNAKWWYVDYGETTLQEYQQKNIKPIGWFDILFETAFAQVSYFSTTADGSVEETNSTSWATARSQATGDGVTETATEVAFAGEKWNATDYQITRHFYIFDTSSITDGDTIDSATLTLDYGASNNQTEATYPANLSLVSGTPANETNIDVVDFDQVGATKFATDITLANFVTNDGGTFTLNASGLANVDKTGNTVFSLRPSNDFSDSTAPTARSYAYITQAEASGTANDPVLVVTTSSGGGGGGGSSATSTADEIIATSWVAFIALLSFALSLTITLWTWTRFL